MRSHALAILFMANEPGNGAEISCSVSCFLFCIVWASPYFVRAKEVIFWISSPKQGQVR
jgi:hypothetical protein